MVLAEIIYIQKSNRQTIIKQKDKVDVINEGINEVLNKLCLTNMSTLSGRIDACRSLLHLNKFTPIYVNYDLILLPLFSSRYWNQIYVNSCMVKEIKAIGEKTEIIFYDGAILDIDSSIKRIKRLIEKSLKIRKTFIYERGKN